MLIYWFALQVFSGLGSIARTHLTAEGGGVAWFAHVGGFISGVVLIKIMGADKRRRRQPPEVYW
jgi:membrane associated rhomboid family serine protease